MEPVSTAQASAGHRPNSRHRVDHRFLRFMRWVFLVLGFVNIFVGFFVIIPLVVNLKAVHVGGLLGFIVFFACVLGTVLVILTYIALARMIRLLLEVNHDRFDLRARVRELEAAAAASVPERPASAPAVPPLPGPPDGKEEPQGDTPAVEPPPQGA